MTQDTTTQHCQPPPPPPITALAGATTAASGSSLFQGAAIRSQGPVFAMDAAGVDLYQGQPNHPPPLVPAPPVLLPSQHDILHATLQDALNGTSTPVAANMDGNEIPRQIAQTPSTLPTPERTDQPPLEPKAPTSPRPKRRGRKPKNYHLSSSSDPSSSSTPGDGTDPIDPDGDGLPKDPRRRRVLERNRIAATKCRVRKRDEAEALAVREKDMYDQNRQLSTHFDSLTAEIYHLKTQLLRHTDCDCILIQKYIANEARRSVDCMTPISSASPCHRQHMALAAAGVTATAPFGAGSPSPYPYGRLGSSAGSSADSASLRGPEDDGGTIPGPGSVLWTNPFPPTLTSSTSNPHIPSIPLPQQLPQHTLESSPPNIMAPTNVVPITPVDVAGYGENLSIGIGPQSQRVDDVGWDYQWNFH